MIEMVKAHIDIVFAILFLCLVGLVLYPVYLVVLYREKIKENICTTRDIVDVNAVLVQQRS